VEARNKGRKSVVASGKTVKEAIANGLAMLGMSRDEVEVEILTEGSRGVLGFGAEDAQVKLLVNRPSEPEPAELAPEPRPEPEIRLPQPAPRPRPEPEIELAQAAPQPRPEPEIELAQAAPQPSPVEEAKPEAGTPTPEQVGQEMLAEMLKRMGIRGTVEAKVGYELTDEDQAPPLVLDITGDDLGILIGRRGETLKALQYLIRLMVSHRLKQWTNLVVDVESYLTRRRHALESLALREAERVARTGRTQALEPMPPYERRLVHMVLRNHPRVTTKSVGEGEKRKVTIVPRP
jgi:spoIIIJ-associated protein